jgi:thymidylate kinase
MSLENDPPFFQTYPPPQLLLILGVDGSGKNHVANVLEGMLKGAGYQIEKRAGGFSSPVTLALTSEDKGQWALWKERIFLWSFPLLRGLVLTIATLWIRRDLQRYPKSPLPTLIISHSPLRLIAFYLGHRYHTLEQIRLPLALERLLQSIPQRTGATTIVLDIEPQIRRQRVAQRLTNGTADYLDRYMAKPEHQDLSERIEASLVWLAQRYLAASVIENNDLSPAELSEQIQKALLQA